MKFDRNKTIEQLENFKWKKPQSDATGLIQDCYRLRRIPLKEFEPRDLLEMITQGLGLEYLIPMALELLRVDPLSDRDFYPGCLLEALLQAPFEYWNHHPDLREEVEQLYKETLLNEKNDENLEGLEIAYLFFTEFGPYISLLWDTPIVNKRCNCTAVKILAIIASRQPVTAKQIGVLIRTRVSDGMIDFLLTNELITYTDDGPQPATRYFRLSNKIVLRNLSTN